MKKIFFSIVALAALAACTKSEVAYEPSAEIGFAPTTKNITKAAMDAGVLSEDVDLGVWALWNYNNKALVGKGSAGAEIHETNNPYSDYVVEYLNNVTFTNRPGSDNWGGKDYAYPWPTNGSLVFAGYTIPLTNTGTLSDIDYTLNNPADKMTFTYEQSVSESGVLSSFDLCWFGATNSSYNFRTAAGNTGVGVTLSHALSWITFKAYGADDVTVPESSDRAWKIKSITLKDIYTKANAECVGTNATWNTPAVQDDIVVYSDSYSLTKLPTNGVKDLIAIENIERNTLVIPQEPVDAEVIFTYPVGDNWIEEKVTVNLDLNGTKDPDNNANTSIEKWQSGIHYIYTLYFKANEILIAPSYGDWTEQNYGVTVE